MRIRPSILHLYSSLSEQYTHRSPYRSDPFVPLKDVGARVFAWFTPVGCLEDAQSTGVFLLLTYIRYL